MYFQPTTLDQAVQDAQTEGLRILAGGTDFFPMNGDRLPEGPILDVTRIKGMTGITRTPEGWRIGGATCWSDILKAELPLAFDGLKAAAREVGSIQIQNAGTIAGNLCNASPAADSVPPLLTLGAKVELTSASGRRLLHLEDFILGVRKTTLQAGEILTAVHIADAGQARSAFSKLGSRKYLVISIAMVAVLIEIQDGAIARARVAVGACSPVAQRLPELEAELQGCRQVAGLVTPDHLSVLSPIDDVRGSAEYRLEVVAPMIEEAIERCLEST
ncbi:FAD binding domain-containing protein [Neptunicoccus cionae]|uniref:FAD binding domain-containing protein n=1 Tax=Neptunicoccus cionae TaxID=2035344 RepID=UPI000C7657E7|nr:FAD binding domain-containing protein [Amylibacter cionae]PLS23551.1 xanthine dehydrogenase [Amylibacter cionae]